ncbi:MAG: DUF3842 family protein [Clostridiales bacterium]|nr:DUF3842 family protein [Clostridiales bacterium]MDD7034899.1 DUF3842 family protein [Bacillota bacterium]MDY2920340.1 DUF3842 family protein [Lentihominibacter sp.]
MKIAVVDGQGGGIGKAVVEEVRKAFPDLYILALGTNALATGQMLKAGATEGATGENAIIHNMEHVDVVIGVVGILCANSMMGELSPAMAQAIGGSHTHKVLLPINRCHIHVVSVAETGLSRHIRNVIDELREIME